MNPNGVAEIEAKGAEAFFKITGSLATSNMVLFDSEGKIKKYSSPEEILDDFYPLRLSHYQKRKAHLVKELENLYERLSNQARFVLMIVKKELIVANRKRKDLVAELREKEFRPFPKQAKAHVAADVDDNEMEDADEPGASADFDYLLGMAIYNLTKEKASTNSIFAPLLSSPHFTDKLFSNSIFACRSIVFLPNVTRERLNSKLFSFVSLKTSGRKISTLSLLSGR